MTTTRTTHTQVNAADSSSAARALPDPHSIHNLAQIARDALRMVPPAYGCSIFGLPITWLPPHRRFSEFTILDPWRPLRAAKYIQHTCLPTLPVTPPTFSPPWISDFFWQPSVILQRPDHNGSYTSFPGESWFFVNGVMTDDAVAQVNAALLAELFHRPITLIQNSTSSLLTDLLQCALDKAGWRITEPVTKTLPAIYDALKRPDKARVVVIAHSQGTIIAAAVLQLLKQITRPERKARGLAPPATYAPPEFIYPDDAPLVLSDFAPLTESEFGKLEIYCFATCANVMTHYRPAAPGRPALPHLEHFGNEHDIVARLGMQAPHAADRGIQIDGARFVRAGAWGHLLSAHYLYPLADVQRQGRRRGGRGDAAPFASVDAATPLAAPRLYAYLNGGSPD
jgi:hypothetical protein